MHARVCWRLNACVMRFALWDCQGVVSLWHAPYSMHLVLVCRRDPQRALMFLQALATALPLIQNFGLLLVTVAALIHSTLMQRGAQASVRSALWDLAKLDALRGFVAERHHGGDGELPPGLHKQVRRRDLPAYQHTCACPQALRVCTRE